MDESRQALELGGVSLGKYAVPQVEDVTWPARRLSKDGFRFRAHGFP